MANGKTMQAVVNLAGSIDPSLGKAIEQAQKKISGLNVKALAVGAAVGGIAVATGKAVIEAGKYMKDLGASFDDAADAIRIGTGATGDALDGLLDDFDAVYKSVPTTMEDASKAIADYNTRLGLTGPQLQEISKQAIQVSDMLGDDLGSVIEESSQAFQQWSIDADDMGGAMDYIFKVSQSTGMGFTDLMADMQKFGPQLQEMGYSFETASALMGQLDKAGVNTDEVLGAMKKSVATLAKEGISASDGLAMYYEKIKNAGTAAEAASIASEIFGTRAGSTMAAAIRDGSLAVADLTAELQENGETIAGAADDTYDFAERLQVMKQGLEVALKPMANTVFDGLNKFMPTLQKLMEQITPAISKAVEAAAPFVDEFLTGAADALEDVLPLISQLAADLLPVLTQLMSTLLPPLLNLVQTLLPPLMQIVSAILPPIASLLATVLPIITQIVSAVLPVLVSIISSLLPVITPANDFEYRDEGTNAYGSAEAVNGGLTGTFAAPNGGDKVLRRILPFRMTDQSEADRFAKGLLRDANKNATVGTLWTGSLLRDYAAGSVVTLATDGVKSWDGTAFISRIRHDYVKTRSKLYLRKPLEGY